MPGIVFDTRDCVGALSCLMGIIFDTHEGGGLPFAFFCSLLLLGIVFDTYDCVGGEMFSLVCWVSF